MLSARPTPAFARPVKVDVRRAERRFPHRTPCCVVTRDSNSGARHSLTGETVNISESGVAVLIGESLPNGAPVEVMLQPVEGETTLLFGEVTRGRRVNCGTFEVGIRVTGYTRPA